MNAKQFDFFLMYGALGVGKTTVGQILKKSFKYDFYELDSLISKEVGKPVSEYFNEAGMYKFYDKSRETIISLYNTREKLGFNNPEYSSITKPIIIDVGSGSIYDYRAIELIGRFNSILLSADPQYLFETRDKAKEIYKDFGYYTTWQFTKEKEMIYNTCDIKVDVSYLSPEETAYVVHRKIREFMRKFNEIEEKSKSKKELA